MTEYLVFPLPEGFVKVEASNTKVARNKYRRKMPDYSEDELIIVPSSFAVKTNIDTIVSLHKCDIIEIE